MLYVYFFHVCWSRGISETYGFTLVRPSVRTDFLRNTRIRFFCFFSWSSGSINAEKWHFRFLAENSKLALFWTKMVQNWPFLAKTAQNQCFLLIFLKWRIRFFWFFSWSLSFMNVKKCLSKIQNWPFFGQKRPKFGHFLSFDLILTPNFLIGYFLYEIVLVKYFFNIFVCYAAHVTQFWPISGGRVV